jgi:hypothetical protein
MRGIGSDKAYRIWFKALTTKFTSSTNYADARNKVLQAAQELYGAGSKEAVAVQRAYAAINVGADIDEADEGGGATSAQLSFALHIDTAETSNTVYDTLTVTLRAASGGAVLATLATYTNLTPAAGYQLRSFDLLAFKDQSVTLTFAMREDRNKQTSFVLDKVSLLTR